MKKAVAIAVMAAVILMLGACAVQAADTPEQVYTKMGAAMKTGDVAGVKKLVSKRSLADLEKKPLEQQKKMLQMMSAMMPAKIKIVNTKINGNAATLSLEGVGGGLCQPDEKSYGKVSMVKENGEWKFDKEQWNNKPIK